MVTTLTTSPILSYARKWKSREDLHRQVGRVVSSGGMNLQIFKTTAIQPDGHLRLMMHTPIEPIVTIACTSRTTLRIQVATVMRGQHPQMLGVIVGV